MRITNWDDADQALKALAELDRRAGEHRAKADRQIATIKDTLADLLRPVERERETLAQKLETFVRAHEHEMDGRSRALLHGKVWLRKVRSATARSWARVLDWLLANTEMEYVHVEHKVNKEALHDAPDELLKACGARIKEEDRFGYDPAEVTK